MYTFKKNKAMICYQHTFLKQENYYNHKQIFTHVILKR